jgi:hypothetical protein
MRIRMPKLTYGNVVSTLALFIALGGVSYAAATLPKNSVGSAQIKAKAVTEKKLAKGSVTSTAIKDGTISDADVKNGSISGGKINAGSLGTVPFATNAGSAASSDQISGAVVKRVGPSADNVSPSTAQAQATEIPLVSHGAVSVYAKCFTSSGSLYFGVYYKTTQNGALVGASTGPNFYGSPFFLDTTTAESARTLSQNSTSNNNAYYLSSAYYGIGTIVGPDGKGLNFRVNAWAKNGDISGGTGAYGVGQVCVFTGSAEKLNLG